MLHHALLPALAALAVLGIGIAVRVVRMSVS